MTRSPAWVDPRNGMRWDNIVPTGARVIPGTAATAHLNSTQIKNVVPGAKARSLAEVWGLDPQHATVAGKKRDHR